MLPDRVSNPGPLTYESDALPIALRGPAICFAVCAPFNLLMMHDKQKSRQASPFLRCFWSRQINLISKDTITWFSLCRRENTL